MIFTLILNLLKHDYVFANIDNIIIIINSCTRYI